MGWSVDSLLFETGKCSVEAENIGKMWNFFKKYARLVQFPRSFSPHDFGKILTFQSGKLEKELCATNPSNRNFQNLCLTSTDILDIPDYLLLCLPAPMRLWRMVCALCRELRRLWHEATEATHFFDEFSLRLLFFRFRFEPHPTPFFCHVFVCFFFFFRKVCWPLRWRRMRTSEFFLVFLLMLMRRPGGSPKTTGRENICWLAYVTSTPIFFGRDRLQWKKHTNRLKIQNAQVFLMEKMLILFVWFFWWVESCTSVNQRAMDRSSQDILWEEMVFWGKKSPGCRKHPSRDFGKDSPSVHWVSQSFTRQRGRGGPTRNKPKKSKCHLNLMLLEQWTKIQVVWDIYMGIFTA